MESPLSPVAASALVNESPVSTAPVSASFPIVGRGASAGGRVALEAFFSGMPPPPIRAWPSCSSNISPRTTKASSPNLTPEPLREAALATLAQLSRTEVLRSYRTQRPNKSVRSPEVSITSTALINEIGRMYAIATTEWVKGNDAS